MSAATTSRAPASRRRRRTVASAATIVAVVIAGATPLLAGGAPVGVQGTLFGVAAVAIAVGLAGWPPGLTLGALALGTEYTLRLQHHHSIDAIAVLEATAIFATVELGLRALDARSLARPEPAVRRWARWQLVTMIVGAAGCAFVVLLAGGRRLPAPTAGLALGLTAAATLLTAAEVLRRSAAKSGATAR